MAYSKKGWTDQFEVTGSNPGDEDEVDYWFELGVVPGDPTRDPPHCLIATLTVRALEHGGPVLVHRSEHLSLADGVAALRAAAERAETLRKGPDE